LNFDFRRKKSESNISLDLGITTMIALGLEGSANKVCAGIISHPSPTAEPVVLANLRHTYNSPPGTGFLPKDTAVHHRKWIIRLIKEALHHAKLSPKDVDVICYTRGPGMGACLQSVAIAARTIATLWGMGEDRLIGVNHCVAREFFRHARFISKSSTNDESRY
jgi:N6-L-threonylcarbamoyladenine synthase